MINNIEVSNFAVENVLAVSFYNISVTFFGNVFNVGIIRRPGIVSVCVVIESCLVSRNGISCRAEEFVYVRCFQSAGFNEIFPHIRLERLAEFGSVKRVVFFFYCNIFIMADARSHRCRKRILGNFFTDCAEHIVSAVVYVFKRGNNLRISRLISGNDIRPGSCACVNVARRFVSVNIRLSPTREQRIIRRAYAEISFRRTVLCRR